MCRGSRSPHGERGLKYIVSRSACVLPYRSLPSRGAWIEITFSVILRATSSLSLPSRGAWIEICGHYTINQEIKGRSPHGERGLK